MSEEGEGRQIQSGRQLAPGGERPVEGPMLPPEPDSGGGGKAPSGPAASAGSVGPDTVEEFGRPMRRFSVAVSSEAMALAWANRENAPQGAAVVVDHEINPRGLHGKLWDTPQADSLVVSVVLRPPVSVEEADVTWLLAAMAGAEAVEATWGRKVSTWWPDLIVETESEDPVGAVKAEVQLGPGQVKCVVITVRIDLLRLDIEEDPEAKDRLLEALLRAVDRAAEALDDQGAAKTATAYEEMCLLMGKRMKLKLRPKGETRGIARHVDKTARLELQSLSGMAERIGVDQLMELEVL